MPASRRRGPAGMGAPGKGGLGEVKAAAMRGRGQGKGPRALGLGALETLASVPCKPKRRRDAEVQDEQG